ncbi:hypothetical protein GOBAR_AA13103 [Gossypium barbadense]|uniref:Uncharacterized protein n=1 Tax=Gossypium barbadense TaxID=3634 RepID=A0A2P5XW16_GOSBA|nr:hypothetical protein GOBAR_AA13103 [Gossypium barbadense]
MHIVGLVVTTVSTSSSERPIHVPVSDKDYLNSLKIWMLLDQCSEAERRGIDQFSEEARSRQIIRRGNNNCPSNVGSDVVARRVHILGHRHPLYSTPRVNFDAVANAELDADTCTFTDDNTDTTTDSIIDANFDARVNANMIHDERLGRHQTQAQRKELLQMLLVEPFDYHPEQRQSATDVDTFHTAKCHQFAPKVAILESFSALLKGSK